MTNINFYFPEQLGAALGWMVLHVLWQATLIGIAAGLALVAMRRGAARRRYWTANAALASILLAALGTFIYYYYGYMPAQAAAGPAAVDTGIATAPVQGIHAARFTPATLPQADGATPADYFNRHLPAIVALWFLGMSLFLLRLLGNIGYAYYLKTHLNFPTEPCWQEMLDRLAQKSGLTKAIRLVESALVRTPMVAGHLKPVILFPIGMINRLDPREAEAILAHELAHILRHDYLFNILQSIVETLFYFHPAVWWLSGAIRHEREIAADDDAIRLTGNPIQYAKALVVIQDMALLPAGLSPAFAGSRKNRLLSRIQHVLNVQQSKNLAMEKFIGTCGILLIIIGIAYAQTNSPRNTTEQQTPAMTLGDARSGVWQGTIENDTVCMTLSSRTNHSSWMNGECFPTTAFSSLPATEADFTMIRPAGTITFHGKFEGKEGYGRFRFEADQAFANWLTQQGITGIDDDMMINIFFANIGKDYVASLKKSGFDKISGEELHNLAIHQLSQKDIQSYQEMAKDLGEPKLAIDELVELKIHGVDQDYAKTMLKIGFPKLSLDNIRDARIHGISPEYIRQCQDLGFEKLDFDQILNFKIHDITAGYIQECRRMGYTNLGPDDVMNFRIHEMTPEYLNSLKAAGLTSLSADEAMNMKIHNVSPATIAEFRNMGFANLSADDILGLQIHEITPAFLNEMKQIGFKDLSVEDAMSLKIHDVSHEFLDHLAKAGFKNLTVDEAVSCRIHEVTAESVQGFSKLGFNKISVEDAINLKIHEVTPEFIQRMRDKGFKDMSLEEYIQLKIQYGDKMK